MHYSFIYTLILSTLLICFSGCNTVKKVSPEQQREALKDSVINASFKGLMLGDSYVSIIGQLKSMQQSGEIEDIEIKDASTRLKDLYIAINAHYIQQVVAFKCDLFLKDGEQITKTEVQCNLGFLYDSLYTVMLLPVHDKIRFPMYSDKFEDLFCHKDVLKRDKVLETYSERYGNLYYITDKKYHDVLWREDVVFKWCQISEFKFFSYENLIWKFKDVEIYLCDKTDNRCTYMYSNNQQAFERAYKRHLNDYSDSDYGRYHFCESIKDDMSLIVCTFEEKI